jgi:hypothetical protein
VISTSSQNLLIRNKPGGDINDRFFFNEAISQLGLIELPFKGRKYTWSNM